MPCRRLSGWLRLYERAWAIAILTFAAVVPPRWLDDAPPVCPYRALTGRPCLGCGMTRAVVHVMHGRPADALGYNRRVVVVFPLILGVGIGQCHSLIRSRRGPRRRAGQISSAT